MKDKRKVFAKLNLTLDILGVENGFHALKSLVCSISVFDTITLKPRKDRAITLKIIGADLPCDENNNAYKACRAFMKEYKTLGADIIIEKNIPIGGGLGGSSADIAGVLLAMQKVYNIKADLNGLASSLGSDVNYMLNGGYAVMQGKGERVTPVISDKKLYFILALADGGSSAKQVYGEFDKLGEYTEGSTDLAVKALVGGDFEGLVSAMKNDLYNPAKNLLPQTGTNLSALKEVCGNAFMTGSGSVTFSVFDNVKDRNQAFEKLKDKLSVIKAQSAR